MPHKFYMVVVGLMCALAAPVVEARNAFTFDGFKANVTEFQSLVLSYCRKEAANILNTSGVYGRINDPDNFRRACGQGLHGREIPYTKWRHFYDFQGDFRGSREIMGVVRRVHIKGVPHEVVLGLTTRISRPHNQPEERERLPMATVLVHDGTGWRPLWNFINPAKNEFQRPRRGIERAMSRALDDVWRRIVTVGLSKLVWAVKDARGASAFSK